MSHEGKDVVMKIYKGAVCKGSIALGSACMRCERCEDERKKIQPLGPEHYEEEPEITIEAAMAMVCAAMEKAKEHSITAEEIVSKTTKALRLKDTALRNLHRIIQHKESEASRLHNQNVDLLKQNRKMRNYILETCDDHPEAMKFLNKFSDL